MSRKKLQKNKLELSDRIQIWYDKSKNTWWFKFVGGVFSMAFIGLMIGLLISAKGNQIAQENNQINQDINIHNVAKDYSFEYSMKIDSGLLILYNNMNSKIDIMTDESKRKNYGISCILNRSLKNNLNDYTGNQYIIKSLIKKGKNYRISLNEIIPSIRFNTLYQQELIGELICEKDGIILDAQCGNDCLDQIIQFSGDLNILLIDRSSNEAEMFYEQKKKKIIKDVRIGLSGENRILKVMHADAVSSSENILFVNNNRYSLTGDIVMDIKKIISNKISVYNKLPINIKPMTRDNYLSIKYPKVNSCKECKISPKFSNLNIEFNSYDINFLDHEENFNLDFRILLNKDG